MAGHFIAGMEDRICARLDVLREEKQSAIQKATGRSLDGRTGKRVRMSEREIAAARQRIGMVFQSYNLFPHMNGLQNKSTNAGQLR
jgi:ABC-type polar amino acid transport system ATPase subunit